MLRALYSLVFQSFRQDPGFNQANSFRQAEEGRTESGSF